MKKEKKLFLQNIFTLKKKSLNKNTDILQFLPKNKKQEINYTNHKDENINKTNDICPKPNVCEHFSYFLNNKNEQEEHKKHSSSLKQINRYYSEKHKKNYNDYKKNYHKNGKQNYSKKYPRRSII